jgi:uncharacterized membrane protein
MSGTGTSRWWLGGVWLGTVIYAVLLSVDSIHRHERFQTSFDLAVYDQLLWLLAHWHDPFSTLVSRPMLGDHFTPGLVLLTPVYWVGLDLPGLLVAQAIGLGLTAPALFALARDAGASAAWAAVPALLWLLSPWTATANLFEFHPTAFAPALLVLSVLAARRRRWLPLAATMLLALSLREDVAAAYLVLGLVLAWQGRRRAGAVVAGGSALWALVATRVVESQSDTLAFFGKRFAGTRGDSVGEALLWMARHPWETISDAVQNSGTDVLLLLAATGGLALLAPAWALLAIPTILHNALTANVFQHDLVHSDHLVAAAGLFVAAALGVRRVAELGRGRALAALTVAEAAAVAILVGLAQHAWFERPVLEQQNVRDGLAVIPSDASVAATIHLQPHVSQRVEVYALPEPFVPWDWGSPLSREELSRRAAALDYVAYYDGDGPLPYVQQVLPTLRRQRFAVVYERGRMRVFKRQAKTLAG